MILIKGFCGRSHSQSEEMNSCTYTAVSYYYNNISMLDTCNFIGAIRVYYAYSSYGVGSGSIHMRNVRCTGTENRLIDCSYSSNYYYYYSRSYCNHYDDAGVICQPGAAMSVLEHSELTTNSNFVYTLSKLVVYRHHK